VLILGIPAVVFLVGSHAIPGDFGRGAFILGRLCNGVFLGFTVALIIRTVLTQSRVTADTIVGGVCGYLLIGALWTDLYCLQEVAEPGSFSVSSALNADLADADTRRELLEYFSFVTLTTVGYGDIVPTARTARALAAVEAICGQFYLGVLVAGLVSLHVGAGDKSEPSPHKTTDH
jgi:voltage-gated potassium channel